MVAPSFLLFEPFLDIGNTERWFAALRDNAFQYLLNILGLSTSKPLTKTPNLPIINLVLKHRGADESRLRSGVCPGPLNLIRVMPA